MEIKQSGSQLSAKGPAEHFTGNVRIDPLFPATDPSRLSAGLVTFEPGARTAWHTRPLGQRLIVTAGCGWVQCWGGPKREIRAGDVVVLPASRKALARRNRNHRHEPYCDPGGARRQGRRLAGEGQRSGIPGRSRYGVAEEPIMPHVIVKMHPGRSEQQKAQLTEAIVKDVMTFTGVGDEAVSVSIEEIGPSDWMEKVYQPDILNGPGKLYKKPEYDPRK
jgi:quercetin dioxygenase-like cupin family protein/phenylpyruvate tautomerase PptA (4-oxalocrotonate tautomerase family)